MKIKRMTACFGCLDHETLGLEEGLNILTLPNEGGKSTWCAFLRVMLYGLNTRERDKKGFLADKSRYLPWNGSPMEGELLISWRGRDILIRRYTKASVPMGAFEAVYSDTGDPVPGLTGDNLGDVLIGVSRSVFERSAFLGQSGLAVSQTPELEKRLAALVSSGEEGVSATQARERLADWQRKRQYRGRGAIPTLEARRSELTAGLEAIRDVTGLIRENRTRIDRYEEMRLKLKHQVDLHQAISQSAQAQAYAQAQAELKQAGAQLEKLKAQMPAGGFPPKAELERARDEVAFLRSLDANRKQAERQVPEAEAALAAAREAAADPVFRGNAAAARSKAAGAERQLGALEREQKKAARGVWLVPVVFCVLFILNFAGMFLKLGRFEPGMLIPLGFLAVGAVGGALCAVRKKRFAGQIQSILAQFQAGSAEAIADKAEDYGRRLEAVSRAEEELKRAQKTQADLRTQRDEVWNRLHDLVVTFAPEVKDVFGFSAAITRSLTLLDAVSAAETRRESAQKLFDTVAAHGKGCAGAVGEEPTLPLEQAQAGLQEAQRRLDACQNDLSMALGRRSTLGEPEALQAEIESADRSLASLRADYDALQIALDALDQADGEMRNRFSPELNRRSGIYFQRLTQGRYGKVRLNRALDAGAEEQGGVVARDVLSLSRGTADQLWLAVRLAVCDLALPGEELCPLVLDDALVNFDDQRVLPALGLLEELARRRQIILFTCHNRERRLYQSLRACPEEEVK